MKLPIRKVLEIRAEKDGKTLTAEWIDDCDYVEVVRCQDCKHFTEDTSPVGYGWCYLKRDLPQFRGTIEPVRVDYNDYCSYGETND